MHKSVRSILTAIFITLNLMACNDVVAPGAKENCLVSDCSGTRLSNPHPNIVNHHVGTRFEVVAETLFYDPASSDTNEAKIEIAYRVNVAGFICFGCFDAPTQGMRVFSILVGDYMGQLGTDTLYIWSAAHPSVRKKVPVNILPPA
ncbi:MAG: hypothetical protein JWN50_342 [Parcubacteria group bacterium]|nr:hypothetical protein [Parcubacteria group bacterium]